MRIEYLCGDCAMPYATRKEAEQCLHTRRPAKRVVICDCLNEIRGDANFCGRCGKEVKETE
jgi:hypothetical protein